MNEEAGEPLRNFEVYGYCEDGFLYAVKYPSTFTAEIAGSPKLEDVIPRIVKEITSHDPGTYKIFTGLHTRIPYGNKVVDEQNRVAAFILLEETPLVDGMSWNEGLYGLRVFDDRELLGRLIDYNSGTSGGSGHNEGSRLFGLGINDGIITYTLRTRKYTNELGDYERERDLRRIGKGL